MREREALSAGACIARFFQARLYLALGVTFLLVGALLCASFILSFRLVTVNSWVMHTHQVLEELEKTLAIVKDTESNGRAYVITGLPAFFNAYHAAAGGYGPHLQRLRNLTADNPRQQARIAQLDPIVKQRLEYADLTVQLRTSEGFDAARAAVAQMRGMQLMDQVRRLFVEMDGEENALLVRRTHDLESATLVATSILSAGGLLMLLLFFILLHALRRQQDERDLANAKLQAVSLALERSNQDLQQFASIAAHDLQAPLRSIMGFLDLLEQRCGGQLDEKGKHYISRVMTAAKNMQTLVADLLSYSRVQTQGKPPAPVESSEAFKAALSALQAAVQESGATITCDALPAVMADISQLSRLYQNLIGNAVKYRKQDVPPVVHVSARRTGDAWTFSVKDNGIGMDMQYAERIFLIFQRLHNAEQYSGTGIGLAVCKRIVERHGGSIWVESSLGSGSTFFFTLPAVPVTKGGA